MENEYSKAYMMYRAKNDDSGSASQWNLGSDKKCVFLEMANQLGKDDQGNAKFDWDNKLPFKMGVADIGELLATMVGMQGGVGTYDQSSGRYKGLYHSNKNGNAILKFEKNQNGRLNIQLSVKRDGVQSSVYHTISNGEACVLSTLLRRALEIMYRWNFSNK